MEKTNWLVIILALGLVVTSLILALHNPSVNVTTGNQDYMKNIISVSGNSEMRVSPDKAEIYVAVYSEGKNAQDAQDANKKAYDSVYKALKNMGIKDAQLETTQYYLSPKYSYDQRIGKSSI